MATGISLSLCLSLFTFRAEEFLKDQILISLSEDRT